MNCYSELAEKEFHQEFDNLLETLEVKAPFFLVVQVSYCEISVKVNMWFFGFANFFSIGISCRIIWVDLGS